MDGEVVLSMLAGMVLPGGGTVPMHFRSVVKLQYKQANATFKWSQQTWLHAAAFWENSQSQDRYWHLYQERVSGPQSGKSDLGRPAIMRGMDFNGNISSAEVRLLSSGGATDAISSGSSGSFSVVVGFWAGVSVEMDDVVVLRSKWPKVPSKISSSEEVSVPARAILILPRPSPQSWAAFFSKWEANSSICVPLKYM